MNPSLQQAVRAAAYQYTLGNKIASALGSLRMRISPRKTLIAGPFAGEFGYELMQWQGYIRARRPAYREVHVITYPGRDYLYEGCRVHYHEILLQQAGYSYGLMGPGEARKLAKAKAAELGIDDFDLFLPAHLCTQYHKRLFWTQEFRLLEEPPLDGKIRDIAFHFRAVKKAGPDHSKNYTPELADELAARCMEAGVSAVCVGHPDYAYCAKGCDDLRRVDLRESVAAIHCARAVAGENSGAMHLANLCGKPTILWANDQWRIDYSLRWNPFRVPIYTAANDTHQPAPERIRAAILRSLADLRERTAGYSRPSHALPAQRVAYF